MMFVILVKLVLIPDISYEDTPFSREYLINLALEVVNGVLEVKPPDMSITTHLCRGNYKSSWAFSGSYDLIAPTLFAREKVDGFFLEYDDQRSGGFGPLKYIPEGKTKVVLGLITSKDGQLEDKEKVKARIRQAAEYIPLEQLCLSPQCGFASTHHGNQLSQEDQWQKLKLIVEIADEVWN